MRKKLAISLPLYLLHASSFGYFDSFQTHSREKNIFSTKESNLWEQITNESYVITDENEKPIYIAKEGFFLGSYKYKVTNSDKKVIGHVRRHCFNFGFPFVKERHGVYSERG